MEKPLTNTKILVMVANGVDQDSLSAVQRALVNTGATVKTAGMESGLVNSWNNNTWGMFFPIDQQLGMTLGADYDVLVVPSGARGIQKLSTSPHCERILSSFLTAQRTVVLMGDASTLLSKTDNVGADKNANVMLGGGTDPAAFIAQVIDSLSEEQPMEKIAA